MCAYVCGGAHIHIRYFTSALTKQLFYTNNENIATDNTLRIRHVCWEASALMAEN